MTDLLKDTLTEHADRTQPSPLDLDAIITTGNRRLRRRRVVAIAGTAMVTLAVLITTLTLIKPATDQPAPVSVPFTERRATYAIGSEIHFGQDVISTAPHKLTAFVQTNSGFAFIATGERGLFVADGKQVRKIAAYPGDLTRLTAANHGNLVGWVEDFDGGSDSVIYDVATDREVLRTPVGNERGPLLDPVESPRIAAIDDRFAYLGTLKGTYRWDLKTGKHQLLLNTTTGNVLTAASGFSLRRGPEKAYLTGTTVVLVDDLNGFLAPRTFPGQAGYLSPTGEYLLTAPNDSRSITPPPAALRLFQTTTGKELSLTHPGHPFLIFSQWLTNDTFTAAGLRTTTPNSPVDLLTCSLKSLTCQTTTPAISTYTFTFGPAGTTTPFTLPTGTPIYRLFG
ncbi:hypothetical protein OHA70_33035 [Kribbella sp. NBC_00382]|uniref:hypothetical protein n=1 Tax=Kribbella sp. NBC_00382 TaxID=2975967 RepID=UPI002E1EC8F0